MSRQTSRHSSKSSVISLPALLREQRKFGAVRFPSNIRSLPAKFVRLPPPEDGMPIQNTAVDTVDLMLTSWKLTAPCALICIPEVRAQTKLTTRLELVLRRGIAEAVDKTGAWVFTSGLANDLGATIAGSAMQYGANELSGWSNTVCVGVPSFDDLASRKALDKLPRGMVHRYATSDVSRANLARASVAPKMLSMPTSGHRSASKRKDGADCENESSASSVSIQSLRATARAPPGSDELEAHHTHFCMVEGGQDAARDFRAAIEKYISDNDISGDDIQTPKIVLLIAGDKDTFKFVHDALDAEDVSTGTAVPVLVVSDSGGVAEDIYKYVHEDGRMPSVDDFRDEEYVAEAAKWLPAIATLGKMTGQNTTEQMAFFTLQEDIEARADLAFEIQKALLNDCPNVTQEALLAVAWGEPNILRACLEDHSEILLFHKSENQPGSDEEDNEQSNGKYIDVLQVALKHRDMQVVRTIIGFAQEPTHVDLDELFVETFNRYPVKETKGMWKKPHRAKRGPVAEGQGGLKSAQASGFFKEQRVAPSTEETTPSLEGAQNKQKMKRAGTTLMTLGAKHAKADHALRVLGAMIDGYKQHLGARIKLTGRHGAVKWGVESASSPGGAVHLQANWTDLMMWAVISGQSAAANLLWEKTHDPLRAALMASQLCRRLRTVHGLRADHASLLKESLHYEELALDLLDAIRNSDEALPMLALIPWQWLESGQTGKLERVLMWGSSCIESAAEEDGMLSMPCRKVIAHRHSQYLLDNYFSGNYPGSKTMIPTRASLAAILVQALLPFLPGTVVEVTKVEAPKNCTLKGASCREDFERDEKMTAANTDGQTAEYDPDMLEVVEALEKNDRKFGSGGSRVSLHAGTFKGEVSDVCADITSFRFIAFYAVPKVKFTIHLCAMLAYMWFHASVALNYDDASLTSSELFLWYWAAMRAIGELQDIQEMSLRGLKVYWNSVWNKFDSITFLLYLLTVALRLSALSKEDKQEQRDINAFARMTYALLSVMIAIRLLQFLRYFRSVGVLTLILAEMVMTDVRSFTIISMLVVAGLAVAFGVLVADVRWYGDVMGHTGIWATVWGFFGGYGIDSTDEYAHLAPEIIRKISPIFVFTSLFTIFVLRRLLVTMFVITYNRINNQAEETWLFERAQLILEFKDTKPPLPPPLSALWYLFYSIPSYFRNKCSERHEEDLSGMKVVPDSNTLRKILKLEQESLKKCLKVRKARRDATSDAKAERQEATVRKLDEQNRSQFEALNGRIDHLSDRLDQLIAICQQDGKPGLT